MKYILTADKTDNRWLVTSCDKVQDDYKLKENDFFISLLIFKFLANERKGNGKLIFVDAEDNSKYIDSLTQLIFERVGNPGNNRMFLADVVRGDSKIFIQNVYGVDETNNYDRQRSIEISEEVFSFLLGHIEEMAADCCFINDTHTQLIDKIEDIKFSVNMGEDDKFEIYKDIIMMKINEILSPRVDSKFLYNFYKFIIMNNKLMANGIFITDDNREEKYLEILKQSKSSDADVKNKALKLVKILSEYLEYMDEMKKTFQVCDDIVDIKERVQDCESREEVNKLVADLNIRL